jgi:hypothetical protein
VSARYNIEDKETGLYWVDGEWGDEPEWFTFVEASDIAGDLDRTVGRNYTRINVAEFFAGSEEP